tara:strand:+ start:149 stop:340 length:192 start_codon:yes stop_codon:yes gene_type:complete
VVGWKSKNNINRQNLTTSMCVFCHSAVQVEDVDLMPQEEIDEAPALNPMSKEALNNCWVRKFI